LALLTAATIFVRGFLVFTSISSPLCLNKLGFEERRLPGIQHRVNGPVFPVAQKARIASSRSAISRSATVCTRTCGKATAHLVPQNRRNPVATNAIRARGGPAASTKFESTCLGCRRPREWPLGVIS